MGRADLHVHTTWSDGMMTPVQLVERVADRGQLDVISVADHDQVRGALEAVEWCAGQPGRSIEAVVGTEISASWGRHLVALFFSQPYPTAPFPRFKGLAETAARVADAGGVVIVPHALSMLVPSVGERAMRSLLATRDARRTVVGLEVCSGVVGGHAAESGLRTLNAGRWHLAEVGSSDAHHLAQVGAAFTEFPGRTPAHLLAALRGRETRARWGQAVGVPFTSHARQGWRSLVVKPVRELRAVLTGRDR
ncbi:MAG TPA: PHP-associated domain-containing protein [Chloroflexota bacterium]|nr:PHP-associated domain-containing protein [Chloroflexota bacterium]